jgi:DMSO/TMAO reductase YedYZ heme-binding membrane subunit
MIVVPFVIVFALLAIYQGKFIRKHNVKIYIVISIISIVAFFLADKVKLMEPFVQGYLGLSLLYIVMFTGALKKKSKLIIKLSSVRREYSIIGFIFLTPHATKYFIEFLSDITEIEQWIGIVAYAIMLPLFVTSFMVFRKKFSFEGWKKLQKWAYLAYILIFIHLILVAEMPNLLVYIVLFVPYIILKLIKEYKLYKIKKELANA